MMLSQIQGRRTQRCDLAGGEEGGGHAFLGDPSPPPSKDTSLAV